MARETMTVVINADDNASGVIGNIGKSLGSLGGAATATVAGLTTATAAAVGGLAAAIGVGVSKAADLEQGVADIAAVMGLAADEVSPLKDLIQDLGMDPALKVNATEASDAIMQLAQSGISMTDILDGAARNVVLLSNATGGDMALSAAIASDAMTLFNISAEEMERAVNQITGVTVASKFGIVDYQYALANVGGVASTLGVSFEDLNTTIAAIAPSFSSGMEAGTALKTLFSRMVPASDDAADAMRDIGLFSGMTADEMKDAQKQATKLQAKIATLDPTAADFADQSAKLNQQLATVNESMVQGQNAFFNADGSMKSMAEIAGILQNAISGLSAEQKTATLTTIFGSDAIRASTALATVGAQAFTDLAGSIAQVDAAESAATRMNTFSGAMEVLQGVLDGLMIGIGDAFLPMLRSLIKTFTELIGTHGPRVINTFKLLADNLTITGLWLAKFVETGNLLNEKITDIDPNLRKFALAIDGIVQPIQSLTKQILSVIVQYELWKDVLIGLGIVLTVIALPAIATLATTLAPIIAAAVAVIAVVHLLRNAFESNFGGIRDFVMTATSMITGTFSQIQNGSLTLQEGIVQAFGLIVTLIGNYLPAWQSILVNWGQAIWQWIVDATPIALTKIIDWWTLLSKWVTDNSPAWFAQLQAWGGALWQWIVDSIPVALNMLGTWLGDLVYWIGDKLPTWGALFMSWQIMMVEWIANAIPDAIESLTDFVQGITKNGKDSENSLSRMIARWIKIFTEWMGTRVIPELGPMFLRFALAIGSAVLNILGELFRLGIVIGTEILFGIGQGLLNFVGLDTDLETVKSHIFLGLNTFIGGAESIGKGMINSLATGLVFPEALTTLNTNAGSIWSSIQTNIGDKVSDATTWGTGILTNLSTGLTGAESLGNWILTGISGGLSSSDHLRTLATAGDAVWQVIFGSIPAGSGGESLGQNIITSVSVGMSSSDHLRTLGSAGDNAWAVVTNSLPASSADTVGHGTLNAFSAGLSSSDHLRTLSAATDDVWDTLMQGLPYVEEPPKWGTGIVDNLSLGMQDESVLGRLYANVELIWNGIVAVFVSATRLEEAYNWATTIITQLGYGIVSMIESFIAEVEKIWTGLVNAFTSADKLKEAYNWGVGLITEIAKGAVSWITNLGTEIAKIWTALVNAFTSADKLTEAYNWGVGLISKFAEGAVSWVTGAASKLGTEIAKIWTAFRNMFISEERLKEITDVGKNIIQGLVNGIVTKLNEMMAVGGTLQLIFSNLLTFIRGFFQEASPSKVMMRLGKNIMLGMEIGMLENTPNVIRAARQMAAGVMDATSGLSLDPQMSFSSFGSLPSTSLPSIGTLSNQDMMRPNVTTNNMTYNLSYETMRSAESIQQDIELLNLLYGGGRSA